MSDPFNGIAGKIIKADNHFWILIRDFTKVAEFPVYRFL